MHVLMDLDGTLTDPFPGITRCIQHALAALGRPVPPANDLRWCIGPPLPKSFATLLNSQDPSQIDAAMNKYRERFSTVGLFENSVFPGIADALDVLQQQGHDLIVATSKPTLFSVRIIEHFGLKKYFRSVDGSELDGTRGDKTSLIAHILVRDAIPPKKALMVGDREHDIIGARQNHVPGIGVLWGYGSREELEAAGARACVTSPKELPEVIRPSAR